ncbi:MAG: hypothetical protein CTY16_03860 [Methylobacter sp.]|nr:MAG: hypothetical protein CTY16_03860 [Methylobacter sp.]
MAGQGAVPPFPLKKQILIQKGIIKIYDTYQFVSFILCRCVVVRMPVWQQLALNLMDLRHRRGMGRGKAEPVGNAQLAW